MFKYIFWDGNGDGVIEKRTVSEKIKINTDEQYFI